MSLARGALVKLFHRYHSNSYSLNFLLNISYNPETFESATSQVFNCMKKNCSHLDEGCVWYTSIKLYPVLIGSDDAVRNNFCHLIDKSDSRGSNLNALYFEL